MKPIRLLTLILTGMLPLSADSIGTIDLSVPVGQQKTPVPNLAVYYNFDEADGTVAHDKSVEGLTGTLAQGKSSAPPSFVRGVDVPGTSGYGNALRFTNPTFATDNPQASVSTALTSGSSAVNLDKSSFTIGFWIKIASFKSGLSQSFWVLDKQGGSGSTSSAGWNVSLSKDGEDNWRLTLGLSNAVAYSAAISGVLPKLADGQWHHIGINFNYAPGSSSTAVFWLDGHSSLPETYSDTFVAQAEVGDNTVKLCIGQRDLTNPGFGSPFDGCLDDLFVTRGIYGFTPVGASPTTASTGGGNP